MLRSKKPINNEKSTNSDWIENSVFLKIVLCERLYKLRANILLPALETVDIKVTATVINFS